MKKLALAGMLLTSASAMAQSSTGRLSFQGSDTLAGYLSDIIIASGLYLVRAERTQPVLPP